MHNFVGIKNEGEPYLLYNRNIISSLPLYSANHIEHEYQATVPRVSRYWNIDMIIKTESEVCHIRHDLKKHHFWSAPPPPKKNQTKKTKKHTQKNPHFCAIFFKKTKAQYP